MVRDLFQLNTLYKKTNVVLCGVFVVLLSLYGIFGFQTFAYAVTERTLQEYIVDTSAVVSSLERAYMEEMSLLTLADAHNKGFVDAEVALFVSSEVPTLTLHNRLYE